MNDSERTCVICLEAPIEKNPLYLLTCGCNTSWFHESCELLWMAHKDSIEVPKCPTCRRDVQFCYTYSFDYRVGINQKYLWWCCSLIGLDLFMCSIFTYEGIPQALYLPSQSLFILLLPHIIKSRHDLLYFLHHVRYRYIVFAFSWVIHVFKYKHAMSLYPDMTINLLVFLGFLHTIGLLCQEVHNYFSSDFYYVDPHIHFVTGYNLVHKDVLHFKNPLVQKTPSSTLKPLRRSPRL